MKKEKQVKIEVKQDDENPIAVDVMAEAIVSISKGIRVLRSSRLNDRALFLLIKEASPGYGPRYNKKSVGLNEIKSVLTGIEMLEKTFLKHKVTP